MEDKIEETLFGASEAISPIILSMEHEVAIGDARDTLESYYKAHADRLSAVYCLSGRVKGVRTLKIVLAEYLEAEKQEWTEAVSVLYAVAPANASDEAVLSGLAQKRSELSLALSNEQLAKTGRILNPGYSRSSPTPEPVKETTPEPTPAPVASKPEPRLEPEAKEVSDSETKSKSERKFHDSERKPKKAKLSKPVNADNNKKKAPAKPAGISSFFSKGTKSDVLNVRTRELPLKASSAVVAADDVGEEEGEVNLAPSNKKKQYEKLMEMFSGDDVPNNDPEPSQEQEQDIDVAVNLEVEELEEVEQAEEVQEAESEPEVVEVEEAEAEAVELEVEEAGAEPEELEVEEAGAEPEELEVEEEPPATQAEPESEVPEPAAPEVKEAFIKEVELDDGWSMSEYVPATQPKKETPKPKPKPTVSLPKIPAKPGKKQQSTLTSFFGKKA